MPLVDGHQLEQGDEGGDQVVEVVAAVTVGGKVRVLKAINEAGQFPTH